jgi:hypothetical protein
MCKVSIRLSPVTDCVFHMIDGKDGSPPQISPHVSTPLKNTIYSHSTPFRMKPNHLNLLPDQTNRRLRKDAVQETCEGGCTAVAVIA